MTDWEKAVVMAYTGVVMLSGDKLGIYYRYVQEKMGRPVWTHEFAGAEMAHRIKEAAKSDFLALCADKVGNPRVSEFASGELPTVESAGFERGTVEQHFGPSTERAPKGRSCGNCEYHKPYSLNQSFFICNNICSIYYNHVTEDFHTCDTWREKT